MPSLRASPRRTSKLPSDPPPPPARAKSGCWTCRLRRKKCDEEKQQDGNCLTCTRLRIDCMGWGSKRPEWLRTKEQMDYHRQRIKQAVANSSSSAGGSSSTANGASNNGACASAASAVIDDMDLASLLTTANDDPPVVEWSQPYSPFFGFPMFEAIHAPAPNLDCPPTPSALPPPPITVPTLTLPAPPTAPTTDPATAALAYHGITPRRFDSHSSSQPTPTHADTMAYVFYYFNRVRKMQYIFAGQFVTDVLHDIVVREPFGVVSNAICALASVHRSLLLQTTGIYEDITSDSSVAQQFLNRAKLQLLASKHQHGRFTELDATAALHFVSYCLFTGGIGEWPNVLNIACDWFATTEVVNSDNPMLAMLNLTPTGKFAAKTTMWFDIISAITLVKAPRFLATYKRLFRGGAGFWAGGVQMELTMGCPDDVMLALAEISALAEWKEEERKAARLSIPELSKRGATIERDLRQSLLLWPVDVRNLMDADAEEPSATSAPSATPSSSAPTDAPTPRIPPTPSTASTTSPITSAPSTSSISSSSTTPSTLPNDHEVRRLAGCIFREAAALYLHTVLSGCNPAVPEIALAVVRTADAVALLPSSDVDRSLVWPIWLAGCMTDDPTRRAFFLGRLTAHRDVGNCPQAARVMQETWVARERAVAAASASGGKVEYPSWREVMSGLDINLLLV